MNCPATNRAGQPCGLIAGWGTDHKGFGLCRKHGGNSPGGKTQGAKLMAAGAVATLGLPREIDPHAALMEELYRTAGAVSWLSDRVATLTTEEAHGPVGKIRGQHHEHKPHIWIVMYQTERRNLESIAKTCITCGIAERQVRIAEQQGQIFARALDLILTDLGVRDHPEAPAIVRRHLTGLDGGLAA